MAEFGEDLELAFDTDENMKESWLVTNDGFSHASGLIISEAGLKDGIQDAADPGRPQIEPADIEVDQLNLLGRGAGGVVARAVHKPTGTPLAVKVVRVEDKAKRAQLINELHYLRRMSKSPFLIHLYTVYTHRDTGCVHVVLEYMDYGSLTDVKEKVSTVPEHILALIMMQILEGLKILHLAYVVHRDVKLGNILVNSRGSVKVTDFGISKKLGDSSVVCDTFVGTATHMSPERVLGEDYSFAADIWSLGLCVYELVSGSYPYGSIASFPVLFDNLCNKPEPRLPAGRYTPAICNFVEVCLQKKPDLRMTAIQLQAHDFILENLTNVKEGDLVRWLDHLMRDRD